MPRRRPRRENPRFPSWPWWALGAGIVFLAARRASASESGPDPATSLISAETTASFYGPGFNGRQTANQEIFNQNAMTAASRTLPFNTNVLVTDLDTGAQVTVRINDRGPFAKDANGNFTRDIDLSMGAAQILGIVQKGLARVRLERVI